MDNFEEKTKRKRKKRVKKKKKLSGDANTTTGHADPQAAKDDHANAKKTATTPSSHDTPKVSSTISRGPSSSLPNSDKLQQHKQPSEKRKPNNNKDPKNNNNNVPLPIEADEKDGNNRPPRYSFQVDDTDHCETPIQAYKDLLPILDRIAKSLNKKRSNLIIYDPYYCDGGVKKKLNSYGFTSVINRNRDFYEDIRKKQTPEYDVLVTNPPYSGVHMEKLLEFCSEIALRSGGGSDSGGDSGGGCGKPFLLLLPHFVYTKDYYARALSSKVSSDIFFMVPEIRYSYFPPAWVEAKTGSKAIEQGRIKTAPFPSFWYAFAPSKQKNIHSQWLVDNFGPSGSVRPKHRSKLRYANCTQHIPRDFRGEFDPNKKRANPKARKRAAKRRYDAMKSASSMAASS
eukprot:CAMPEP_0201659332 /NCGR_PEP_ID=MMETSP0494-20130426/2152_1 /ASSEMBLY_ACC=CAM_ASM_000839 /TAXON_ID=420259 /ORGANISM="Thalassiosira gravida, Strain GMp14c1" /LENGTH=398 /DNA_ID=CAMNT_0048136785 /DNA_START=90 /DNA_END=1286 /DNA_ORIENTATION=+